MAKTSSLTISQVEHAAQLARLPIKKSQITKYQSQLAKIFDYVDQIKQLKTARVAETSQLTQSVNRTREDKITPETLLSQDQALSNAQRTHNGYFVVNAILNL